MLLAPLTMGLHMGYIVYAYVTCSTVKIKMQLSRMLNARNGCYYFHVKNWIYASPVCDSCVGTP